MTQQQIKIWHDDYHYCNGNRLIKWYDGYQKRNAQKAKIKEELLPIAWHLSKWWDWYVPEDEEKKKRQKNYGHKHRLPDDLIQKLLDLKRTINKDEP